MNKSTPVEIARRQKNVDIVKVSFVRAKSIKDHYAEFFFRDGVSLRIPLNEANNFPDDFEPWPLGEKDNV